MKRRTLVFGLALCMSAPASSAAAQADEAAVAEARTHFDRGEQFYERGNYALSRDEFVRVYELMVGHPNRGLVLYNIARCHDQLQQYEEAIANYERFLVEAPDDTPERADARNRVAELHIRMREGRLSEPREASPAASSDTPSPEEGLGALGVAGISVGAVGVAAGVVAAITGGLAHGVYTDLESRCGADGGCPVESRDDADYGSSLADASTVLTFVALGTVAVGLVLLIIDLASGDSPEPHAFRAQPGPGGTTMGTAF